VVTLENANEDTLVSLLNRDFDWAAIVFDLEKLSCFRDYLPGMEEHHIEPERESVIFLWPLEHLAIHICHAKLYPTDSNHAKVGAFVKPFPGSYRRIVPLSEEIRKLVTSFGQTRPSKTVEEMTRMSNLPHSKLAQQENGRRSGKITGPKNIHYAQEARRGLPCTWGNKISLAISAKGTHICPHCGKMMKNIASNIVQHERGSKCK